LHSPFNGIFRLLMVFCGDRKGGVKLAG